MQQELKKSARRSADDPDRIPAEWCLRCYISHQIKLACGRLATKFGDRHNFCTHDLLLFVLDDVLPSKKTHIQPTDYQSLADRILQTFNPEQSSLSTWVDLQVKQNRELNRFLLEQGVYLASDWGILNDTTVSQLQRVLSTFYSRTDAEVRAACQLLRAYHNVYRQNRLQAKLQGRARGKCPPPTPQQQQRMNQLLQAWGEPPIPSDDVLDTLKDIAADLRQYRLSMRGGQLPPEPIDPDKISLVPDDRSSETEEEEEEFLAHYRQQLQECLDEAIAHVIEARVQVFQNKTAAKAHPKGLHKAQQFLKALQFLHGRGLSMGEIALKLGLKQQYTVSRLLDLKAFRADVRHQTLRLLRDRILDLAIDYTDRDRLRNLDRGIDNLLGEQIDEILQQAENRITQKRPTDSIFAHRLCRYLDTRNAS